MASWTDIPNSSLETGAPARSVDALAFRDNPIAIAEGATGAPRITGSQGPVVQTNGLYDECVTNAKIANDAVTNAKISIGTRSFSGSIDYEESVNISGSDQFAFIPRITSSTGVTFNGFSSTTSNYRFQLSNYNIGTKTYTLQWNYIL